jgi:hypothetical protein
MDADGFLCKGRAEAEETFDDVNITIEHDYL